MSESLKEKAKTSGCYHCACCKYYHGFEKGCEFQECAFILREDAQKEIDHLNELKQKLSELLKQFEDYPIFHSSLQELEKLLKEKKAKPCP